MKTAAKREGSYALIAALLLLVVVPIFTDIILPKINDWLYSSSPFLPLEQISIDREGDTLKFSGTITKIARCDPTGMPPSYWLWQWGDNGVATGQVMLNGRPLQSRNVLPIGKPTIVGTLEADIPADIDPASLTIGIVVICDRGDGKPRSYQLQPRLPVPFD